MSESDSRGRWTRRRFLETVGRAGGAAAVYESMVALGIVRVPDSAYAGPPQMTEGSGSGKTIVILGAGVAGLTAAYELKKRNTGRAAAVTPSAPVTRSSRSTAATYGNRRVTSTKTSTSTPARDGSPTTTLWLSDTAKS